MIDTMVKFYSGYLQVQDTAYWEEKTLDNSLESNLELDKKIANIKDVNLVTYRIESFALAAHQEKSKPVMVFGINPKLEDHIIKLSDKVISGNFIDEKSKDAMISQGLSKYLNLTVGDTIVLISQGYHGVSAAGKFKVKSVFKHPSPDFDKRVVFLSLETAQEFYSMPDKYTSQVIMAKDHFSVNNIAKNIKPILPKNRTVMTWDEMVPELASMIKSDRIGGIVMLFILYLVVGFGIFGTAMMMLNERKREFGVINAIGMHKYQINIVLSIEMIALGIIGALIGLLLTIPIIAYFYNNPIPLTGDMAEIMLEYGIEPYMYFSIQPQLFINQAIIVFMISLIVSFFVVISVAKMNLTNALRS
jgi:ABC-type lipoprotein release transport system permease subunit